MTAQPRFIPTTAEAIGEETSEGTLWWFDTRRPLTDPAQPYIAVQTDAEHDPNNFVPVEGMCLLFTDQAEYYAVCPTCRSVFGDKQWSGSTSGGRNWRDRARQYLAKHQKEKGWCEFCDPVFGNGGWV